MKAIRHISTPQVLTLIAFAGLFVYAAVRAYNLSFTHDESLTFTIVKGSHLWINSANHHFLNTTFMSWCSGLFGDGEFSLRLPNLLAFGFYLSACYLIFDLSKNKWNFLLGMVLLLNPFALEFFSLARGYGLSLGFMLMSTYFLIRNGLDYSNSKSFLIDFSASILFAALATHSNLPMINFFIAISGFSVLKFGYYLYQNKTTRPRFIISFCVLFLISCIPLFGGIQRLLFLKETHQLYVGLNSIIDSLDALITSSMYCFKNQEWIPLFIRYALLFCIPISIISIIIKKDYFGKLAIITSLNLAIIIGLLLEHYLFGAKFPSERTALVFSPIFGLMFYYLIIHFRIHYPIKKKQYTIILSCIIIPFIINFISSINITYTTVWKYDARTKEAMLTVHEASKNLSEKASISNNWLFQPAIDYYIVSRKMNLHPTTRDGVNPNSDFIYQFNSVSESPQFQTLKKFKDTQSILLQKS